MVRKGACMGEGGGTVLVLCECECLCGELSVVLFCCCIAKKSLKELQQMCFKLKEEVFSKPRAGIAFNSKAMEKMVVDEFGVKMTMNDVKRPKYVWSV